jgi:hypothetical protein
MMLGGTRVPNVGNAYRHGDRTCGRAKRVIWQQPEGLSLTHGEDISRKEDLPAESKTVSIKVDLFDIVAVANSLSNVTLATGVTPGTETILDANGQLGGSSASIRFIAMDAYQMTTQIMLTAEGTATCSVRTSIGFKAIGVMGGHMGLQIISSCKS